MRKKIIILLLVATLVVESIAIPNIKARAEPATVAASLFAALPITWPLVVGILVAAGIGTAAYYASLSETEKQLIFDKVANVLGNCGENMANISAAKNTALINGADYIRAAVVDGVTYISTNDCLEPVFDLAESEGWLGGQAQSSTVASTPDYSGMAISASMFADPYSVFRNWNNSYVNADMKAALLSFVSSYGAGTYIQANCIYSNSNLIVSVTTSAIAGSTIGARNLQSTYRYYYYPAGITYNTYVRHINRSGGIAKNETYTGNSLTQVQGMGGRYMSNFGDWNTVTEGGTPMGEEGQVSNSGTAWNDPWASGADKDITDYGNALPVSGAGTVEAGATWEGDIDIPDSLVLPGVSDPAIDTDIPDSFSQAAAQEGDDYDYPQAVDDVSPVTPDAGAFTLPVAIMDRFPFCIAKDVTMAVGSISSVQAQAPVITGNYLGQQITIDLSWLDNIMVLVRAAELLFYAIGLAMATKYFIRW